MDELNAETNARYDQLIQEIPNERKIKKLEGDRAAWQQAVTEREKEFNTAREEQLRQTQKTFNNRKHYIERILK